MRGLVVFGADGQLETGTGAASRAMAPRAAAPARAATARPAAPILYDGTVLDGELVAERFHGTMAALQGSKRHGEHLRTRVRRPVPRRRRPSPAAVDGAPRTARAACRASSAPIDLSPLVEPVGKTWLAEQCSRATSRASSSRTGRHPTGDGCAGRLVEGQGPKLVRARGMAVRAAVIGVQTVLTAPPRRSRAGRAVRGRVSGSPRATSASCRRPTWSFAYTCSAIRFTRAVDSLSRGADLAGGPAFRPERHDLPLAARQAGIWGHPFGSLVPRSGFEPERGCPQRCLRPPRLPVPPPRRRPS